MGLSRIINLFCWLTAVQIEDTSMVNVALGKPATQSTVSYKGTPDLAVDGNRNPHWSDYSDNSCIHTRRGEQEQWWMVDLLGVYNVTDVWIQNRGDNYGEFFHDFAVEVYMKNPTLCRDVAKTTCNTHPGAAGLGENVHMPCLGETIGRYVKLVKIPEFIAHYNDIMIICEVQVDGILFQQSSKDGVFNYHEKKISTSGHLMTGVTATQCAIMCMDINACYGINVRPRDDGCQLITYLHPIYPTDHPEWNHFVRC